MYNLPEFKENDPEVVLQFVRDHPFAMLCGSTASGKPVATQVPVFIDERDGKLYLSGHIMRNTDHHKAFLENNQVLAVFNGPNCYVSASWYSERGIGSTWNYQTVHARGPMRFLDREALLHVLDRTTAHFENNPDSGANFGDLPKAYIDHMVVAIVAFEIEVEHMDHVFKLSQNRDEASYDNIILQLNKRDNNAKAIAALMQERKSKVFPV
jgi:transcriptional regulator